MLCLSQNQPSVGTPQRTLCAPRCHDRGRTERSLKINTSTRSASAQPALSLPSFGCAVCNQWKKAPTSIFIPFDLASFKNGVQALQTQSLFAQITFTLKISTCVCTRPFDLHIYNKKNKKSCRSTDGPVAQQVWSLGWIAFRCTPAELPSSECVSV